MENFRTNKTRRGRSTNLDGIISGDSRPSKKVKKSIPQVGNFARKDGFHAAQRGSVSFESTSPSAASLGRQPSRAPDGTIALNMPPTTVPKRKRGRRNWSTRKRILIRTLAVFAVLFILVGGFVGWKFIHNTSKVFKGNVFGLFQEDKLKGEDTGRVTILLAGNSADDPGHGGAELTDSILVVSIDTVHHTAYMLSIPRDLWVNYGTTSCSLGYSGKINGVYVCGEQTKFHEAGYPDGGMGLLTKNIEQNFGININYYARIDYTAFRDAVNAVGGINVTIKSDDPRGLYDANIAKADGGPLKLANGAQHLDGQTALNLARARGETISYGFPSSDFTRTEHQRQMLVALKDKALSVGVLTNPAKISSLFDAAGNNVQTDFKTSEIRRLYTITKPINNTNIQSIGLADTKVNLVQTFTASNGTSAVRPVAGVTNFSQIQAYMKRITSNDPVVKEGATVVILNASDIDGLAQKKSTILSAKGITTKATATDAKIRPTTTVVSVNGAQKTNTKAYLAQLFKTTVTTDVVNNPEARNYDADFVIILGQNESTTN